MMPYNLDANGQRNAITQALMNVRRPPPYMPAPPAPQAPSALGAMPQPRMPQPQVQPQGMPPPAVMPQQPMPQPVPPGAQAFAAGAGVAPGASPVSSMLNQTPPY